MTRTEAVVTDGRGSDGDDPTTVFALLSDEIRVAIVRELARAGDDDGERAVLSFSELRCRVGVADSGRFNYHLRRLRGCLVEKTDAGYVLTPAGRRAATAVGATA